MAIETWRADGAADLPEATVCSGVSRQGTSDDCGCDGKTCAAGQRCVFTTRELGAACGMSFSNNQCLAICSNDADCQPDEVCLPQWRKEIWNDSPPHLCIKASCKSDSDCCSGHCRAIVGDRSQCTGTNVFAVQCVDAP